MFQRGLLFAAIGIAVLIGGILFLSRAPSNFPERSFFTVGEGETVSSVAESLKEAQLIRSSFLFKVSMRLAHANVVRVGDYYFSTREDVYAIASRLEKGEYDIDPVTVTLPEGLTVEGMAEVLDEHLPFFDNEEFLSEAREKEGYLFPDTYHFLPTVTTSVVLNQLERTFEEKTRELQLQTRNKSHAWSDVVIMASIIEKEVGETEDRRMVADILWRRLESGMRLQVDAPFLYLLGKTSEKLTQDDLALDSPYNTYAYAGLPPAPISNPGIDALEATLNPLENDFLYYLSDASGRTHFSETYEEHLDKKARFLD